MLQVALTWDAAETWQVLLMVKAQQHAQQPELCTAVSVLLRSSAEAIELLQNGQAWDWSLRLAQEGDFSWELRCWPTEFQEVLGGISLTLATGLRRLARDYPLDLTLFEERWRQS